MADTDGNGWKEHQIMVLKELERNAEEVEKVRRAISAIRETDLPALRQDIAVLKTKAMLWGGVAGTVFGAVAAAVARGLIG
jgi:hypothetical protein